MKMDNKVSNYDENCNEEESDLTAKMGCLSVDEISDVDSDEENDRPKYVENEAEKKEIKECNAEKEEVVKRKPVRSDNNYTYSKVSPYSRPENVPARQFNQYATSLRRTPEQSPQSPDSVSSLSSSPPGFPTSPAYSQESGSPQVVPRQDILFQCPYSPEMHYQNVMKKTRDCDSSLDVDGGICIVQDNAGFYTLELFKTLQPRELLEWIQRVNEVEISNRDKLFKIDSDGDTLLMISISTGSQNEMVFAMVSTVYKENKFINLANKRKQTALYSAVFYQKHLIVGFLLEHGADPNLICNNRHDTPLHYAVSKEYEPCVRALLTAKSDYILDINKENLQGEDALDIAMKSANNRRNGILKLLIKHGARPNRQMLHKVIESSDLETLRIFLENSGEDATTMARIPFSNYDSSTLLHKVVQTINVSIPTKMEFVKLLLRYKADPNATDVLGLCPREWLHPSETQLRRLL